MQCLRFAFRFSGKTGHEDIFHNLALKVILFRSINELCLSFLLKILVDCSN